MWQWCLVEGFLRDPLVLVDGTLEVKGRVVVGAHVDRAAVARVRHATVGVELCTGNTVRLVDPSLLASLK